MIKSDIQDIVQNLHFKLTEESERVRIGIGRFELFTRYELRINLNSKTKIEYKWFKVGKKEEYSAITKIKN